MQCHLYWVVKDASLRHQICNPLFILWSENLLVFTFKHIYTLRVLFVIFKKSYFKYMMYISLDTLRVYDTWQWCNFNANRNIYNLCKRYQKEWSDIPHLWTWTGIRENFTMYKILNQSGTPLDIYRALQTARQLNRVKMS